MREPLDNYLTLDDEWETFEREDEREDLWARLCREADDAYDSRFDFE